MNTFLSVPRVALFALALGTAGVTATFAQTTSTTPPAETSGGKHHHDKDKGVLTAAEKAQLKAAKKQALATNASLQTEESNLKQQKASLKGSNATKEQKQAFHQQKKAYKKDLRAAELVVDPSLSTIFAKLDAAHHGHHHSST